MLRHLATAVLGLTLLVSALDAASAERRVALVIGNSDYENTAALKNPSNDAADMAAKLRDLGFDVIDGTDLSKREMEKRIRRFAGKLEGADVGLFFYAGHGLQVDGRNFLAPVDAGLKSDTDLDFEAIELNLVLRQLERNARVSLVFLDACRDNPLAVNLAQASRSLNVGRGLAQVEKAVGMMIAFATQPGNIALDGRGRNSPFTAALLRHIDAENASINDVMIDVRRDVLEATNGKQVPWENSSLTGQFYFKQATPKTASQHAAEIAALRQEIARLKANQTALRQSEQNELASLEQKLQAETGEDATDEDSRVITVEPKASGESDTAADTETAETKTANLAPPALTDTDEPPAAAEAPEALAPVDQDALERDIQTKLKALNCYTGRIDGDWGPGTRTGVERFNKLANHTLNVEEAEPKTLDALAAWSGENCPTKTIVRQKRAPAPKAAQPKTRAKAKPTYTQKKPAPSQRKPTTTPSRDIETGTVHRLMRPNLH